MPTLVSILYIVAGVALALIVSVGLVLALYWAPDRPVAELATRWAGPPSKFVPIGQMMVHVRDEGPRDHPMPIVMVHGFGGNLYNWQGWADALKGQRRVIRFDLPGFGLTGPSPDNDYSIDGYLRFMRAALDRLAVKRCALAGNSFGGLIAWRTALADPERVQRLILVGAAGYEFKPSSVPLGLKLVLTPGVRGLLAHVGSRALVEASLRNLFGDLDRVSPEFVDRQFEISLREGNRRARLEVLRQVHVDARDASLIAQLRQPTLLLWGERDGLVPLRYAERFHRDIAGSRLVVLEGLGHVPQVEDPMRSVVEVERFLSEHGRGHESPSARGGIGATSGC
jgi:pimeloyl-ACP methyl ester carboxylesterase